MYSSTADKATRKALQKLETVALTAAAKGDAKTAQVSFITSVTATDRQTDRYMVEKKHAPLTYDTLLAGNTWPTLTLYPGFQAAIKDFVTLGQITEMDMVKGTTASSKCSPWRCPSSAPAPPRGGHGGSGQLCTPRKKPVHWAPSHHPRVLEPAASKVADCVSFHWI